MLSIPSRSVCRQLHRMLIHARRRHSSPKGAIALQFGRRIHNGIGMELRLVERPVHVGRGFLHHWSIFLCPSSSSAHDKEADDDCNDK